MSEKVRECITHHHACDCREQQFKELAEINKVLVEALEAILWSWEKDAGRECYGIAHDALAKAKEMGK